ncbi:MAG: dephospho-CoA kinase [Bacteroidia bacterium]
MLKVGITGGIGSGKSTVCSIFRQLGVPIFEADTAVKTLYNQNQELRAELINNFGSIVYTDSRVNLDVLRSFFKDPAKRERLNKIVHPFVFKAFDNWAASQNSPYVIKEAAILFESGADKTVDVTIGVIASENKRLKRTLLRDKFRTEDEVLKIMQTQHSNSELEAMCDYLIDNNEQRSLIGQVQKLHHILVDKSSHFS